MPGDQTWLRTAFACGGFGGETHRSEKEASSGPTAFSSTPKGHTGLPTERHKRLCSPHPSLPPEGFGAVHHPLLEALSSLGRHIPAFPETSPLGILQTLPMSGQIDLVIYCHHPH